MSDRKVRIPLSSSHGTQWDIEELLFQRWTSFRQIDDCESLDTAEQINITNQSICYLHILSARSFYIIVARVSVIRALHPVCRYMRIEEAIFKCWSSRIKSHSQCQLERVDYDCTQNEKAYQTMLEKDFDAAFYASSTLKMSRCTILMMYSPVSCSPLCVTWFCCQDMSDGLQPTNSKLLSPYLHKGFGQDYQSCPAQPKETLGRLSFWHAPSFILPVIVTFLSSRY